MKKDIQDWLKLHAPDGAYSPIRADIWQLDRSIIVSLQNLPRIDPSDLPRTEPSNTGPRQFGEGFDDPSFLKGVHDPNSSQIPSLGTDDDPLGGFHKGGKSGRDENGLPAFGSGEDVTAGILDDVSLEGMLGSQGRFNSGDLQSSLDAYFQQHFGGAHFVTGTDAAGAWGDADFTEFLFKGPKVGGWNTGKGFSNDPRPDGSTEDIPKSGKAGDPYKNGGTAEWTSSDGVNVIEFKDSKGNLVAIVPQGGRTPNPMDDGTGGPGILPVDGSGRVRPHGDVLDLERHPNDVGRTPAGLHSIPYVRSHAPINPNPEGDSGTSSDQKNVKAVISTFDGVFDPQPIESALRSSIK